MSKTTTIISPLSPKGLQGGIKAHLSYGWPADFHAGFYGELHAEMQACGFDKEWWVWIVDNLFGWRALRPLSKAEIIKRGTPQLVNLKREYNRIIAHDKNANIASCDWDVAAGLFKVAAKIKPVQSPVFASKLCHFIMPTMFPIFDRESLQLARKSMQLTSDPTADDYEKYWKCCHALWMQCDCKQELKDILRKTIEKKGCSVAHYPWAAKITGLSLMNPKSS